MREASVTRHAPLALFFPRLGRFIAHSPRICFSTSSFFRRFGGEPSLSSASRFLIPPCGFPREIWAALELMPFPVIRFPDFFRRFPAFKPLELVLSWLAFPAFLRAFRYFLLFSRYRGVAMPGDGLRGYPRFPCAQETTFTPSLTGPQLERGGRPIRLCLTRS